jgi:hypothetical protein
LPVAGLETEHVVAECAGGVLESAEDGAAEPASACLWLDLHAPDLGCALVVAGEAAARDRATLVERDDEVPVRRREDARFRLTTGAVLPVALAQFRSQCIRERPRNSAPIPLGAELHA